MNTTPVEPVYAATAEIRGAGFRKGAKEMIQHLAESQPLTLEREPDNAFDPNAIKVFATFDLPGVSPTPLWLGYIGKEWAAELAPYMDDDCEVEACVAVAGSCFIQVQVHA